MGISGAPPLPGENQYFNTSVTKGLADKPMVSHFFGGGAGNLGSWWQSANPPGGGMFDLGGIRRVSGLRKKNVAVGAVLVMFGICLFVGFGYQQISQGSLNIIKLHMFFG